MIKVIVFDYDGVIEDTYEQNFELFQKQFLGLTKEEHKKLYDGNLHEQKEKLRHRDTGFDVSESMDNLREKLIIKPEIREELIKLSKEYILGIISSGKSKGINTYIKNNRINVFSFVYGSDIHKSKIEKFKIVMQDYNVSSNEIVFITDTLGDILEANKLNIRTIAVDFGYHEKERLYIGNPFKIISKFQDIIPTLEEIDSI
ncbi:MAG: HAD-IA family hydrolase [Candidatus Pacearchaeota archaeon]